MMRRRTLCAAARVTAGRGQLDVPLPRRLKAGSGKRGLRRADAADRPIAGNV
jgi:hypothetical protein